jgi:hypothetical protein
VGGGKRVLCCTEQTDNRQQTPSICRSEKCGVFYLAFHHSTFHPFRRLDNGIGTSKPGIFVIIPQFLMSVDQTVSDRN